MEWTRELVFLLLNHYEQREILWKPRHPLYYNTIKKEDSWREIAEVLNKDVQDVKKRIESLKGSFRREKCRIKNSTGTGKRLDEIYTSKWFAYESMNFLEDRDEPNETLTNSIGEIDEDITDTNDPEFLNKNAEEASSQNLESESSKATPRKLFKSPKRKRSLQKKMITRTQDKRKDDSQVFGEFVTSKLRKLNAELRATGQFRIGTILYELEMLQLSGSQQQIHSNPTPSTSSCSTPLSAANTPVLRPDTENDLL